MYKMMKLGEEACELHGHGAIAGLSFGNYTTRANAAGTVRRLLQAVRCACNIVV